jgi:FkbM family methyltransferase
MLRSIKSVLRGLVGETAYKTLSAIKRAQNDVRQSSYDDQRRIDFYRRWIQPRDLVFDIGANIGTRTRVFERLGARVIAVEPQPHCYNALRWLYRRNRNVEIVRAAVSDNELPKDFFESGIDGISTMNPSWFALGRFKGTVSVATYRVRCVTLDNLVTQYGVPNFVKIDVEGYEPQVLSGLSQPAGTLSFEVTAEGLKANEDCVSRLEQLGYRRFCLSVGESMELEGDWLDGKSIRQRLVAFSKTNEFGDVYALAPAGAVRS